MHDDDPKPELDLDLARQARLSIRLTPRAHFAMHKASMLQKRTATGYVENLLENSFSGVRVWSKSGEPVDLDRAVRQVWNPDPAVRIVRMAGAFPHLLSPREEALWRQIASDATCWIRTRNRLNNQLEPLRYAPENLKLEAVYELYGDQLSKT